MSSYKAEVGKFYLLNSSQLPMLNAPCPIQDKKPTTFHKTVGN
ncbi:MAG: hypothetical protein ACRAVC_01250 [Trichormus sp.]